MDAVTIIGDGLSSVLVFFNLLIVPGLALSLVFFPRFTDMGLLKRLGWAAILSLGAVIASVLFMDFVLGVAATPWNISLGLGLFSIILLVVWFLEVWYLISSIPERLHQKFLVRFRAPLKYSSRIINSWHDRFTRTAMTRVIWHESILAGSNHIDHTYLIDVGEAIEILQVDETKGKVSEPTLLPPPYPRTWYFELAIREFNDGNVSLIDDLQVYPVLVARKRDITLLGHRIRHGALKIAARLYHKTDTAEVQWIYSHDFHLFAILYAEDTLARMVDRVLLKLDEIATSIKRGSRVPSHLEDTQKLRDEFEVVREKPRRAAPIITEEPVKYGACQAFAKPAESDRRNLHADIVRDLKASQITPGTFRRAAPIITEEPVTYGACRAFAKPAENDRRKLHADIVRDLKVRHIMPETFRRSDRMILDIRIPERIGIDEILSSIRELKDEDWLYE